MDIASPIASLGQSTTVATGTVGARCHQISEHAAHQRMRMVTKCTCSHVVRHCSSQISDTVVSLALGCAVRNAARA